MDNSIRDGDTFETSRSVIQEFTFSGFSREMERSIYQYLDCLKIKKRLFVPM